MLKQKKKFIGRYFCLRRREEGGAGSCDSLWTKNKFLERQVFLSLISLVQLLPHWMNAHSWWWLRKSRRTWDKFPQPMAGTSWPQECWAALQGCDGVRGSLPLPWHSGDTKQLPTAESCDLGLKRSSCSSVCPSRFLPVWIHRPCWGAAQGVIGILPPSWVLSPSVSCLINGTVCLAPLSCWIH